MVLNEDGTVDGLECWIHDKIVQFMAIGRLLIARIILAHQGYQEVTVAA